MIKSKFPTWLQLPQHFLDVWEYWDDLGWRVMPDGTKVSTGDSSWWMRQDGTWPGSFWPPSLTTSKFPGAQHDGFFVAGCENMHDPRLRLLVFRQEAEKGVVVSKRDCGHKLVPGEEAKSCMVCAAFPRLGIRR